MEKKRWIIGVSGGSGSGKTTFIRELRKGFTENQLCIISQDDYYKAREEQEEDPNGVINFDKPDCFDVDAFRGDIERLIAGQVVSRKEYTFNNQLKTPKTKLFKPAPVILVEGLFVFHYPKINAVLDIKVFIEAHDALKIKRRILRDQIERNYPLEDVLYRYEYHVIPAYLNFIAPYSASADIIINNHENFDNGILLLKSFISQCQ